jgi:hypothetical protein
VVTDTVTGKTKEYTNKAGDHFKIEDRSFFPN